MVWKIWSILGVDLKLWLVFPHIQIFRTVHSHDWTLATFKASMTQTTKQMQRSKPNGHLIGKTGLDKMEFLYYKRLDTTVKSIVWGLFSSGSEIGISFPHLPATAEDSLAFQKKYTLPETNRKC